MTNVLQARGLIRDIQKASQARGYNCTLHPRDGGVMIHAVKPAIQYMLEVLPKGSSITRMSIVEGDLTRDRYREYEGEDGAVEAAIDLLRALMVH